MRQKDNVGLVWKTRLGTEEIVWLVKRLCKREDLSLDPQHPHKNCAHRQKIHISKKWGFTKFNADEFEDMVAEKRLIPDGCGVKYIPNRGPLDKWRALHS
ncbi:60S ribosomal protein L10 [Microtus ochrogaster]|uniref:60S ribosomal protein L10 n=1 Tax=Microtus ochrogaster TaxID=79684 RepID=A0A8J6GDM3_MICOH|nr:60S ribosomal protein L10 [Microtus ochrogaster]